MSIRLFRAWRHGCGHKNPSIRIQHTLTGSGGTGIHGLDSCGGDPITISPTIVVGKPGPMDSMSLEQHGSCQGHPDCSRLNVPHDVQRSRYCPSLAWVPCLHYHPPTEHTTSDTG